MPNYQIFIFIILSAIALFFNNFWNNSIETKEKKQQFNIEMEQSPFYFPSDINLNRYKLAYGPKRVDIENDLSGLTYNTTTKTLFAYMTIVEQHRPYWNSIFKLTIVLNIYMVFVGFVNYFGKQLYVSST